MQPGKAVQCDQPLAIFKPADKPLPSLPVFKQVLLDDFLHIIDPVGSLIHLNCELHVLSRAIENLQGVATTHHHSGLAPCKGL